MENLAGIVTLRPHAYRRVAEDPNVTNVALLITVCSAFAQGLSQAIVESPSQRQTLFSIVASALIVVGVILVNWVVGAWILGYASRWLGGRTSFWEMLRVTGYVNIFGLLSVLSLLALVGPALGFLAGILSVLVVLLRAIGFVLGVREAGEYSTASAIVTTVIAVAIQVLIYLALTVAASALLNV